MVDSSYGVILSDYRDDGHGQIGDDGHISGDTVDKGNEKWSEHFAEKVNSADLRIQRRQCRNVILRENNDLERLKQSDKRRPIIRRERLTQSFSTETKFIIEYIFSTQAKTETPASTVIR